VPVYGGVDEEVWTRGGKCDGEVLQARAGGKEITDVEIFFLRVALWGFETALCQRDEFEEL